MNDPRIASLRHQLGWTQERLAAESNLGTRTIQRVEAGHDASLETLSRVSSALRVPVRELFVAIAGHDLNDRVEAMQLRSHLQQRARDRITTNWVRCYLVVGLLAALLDPTIGYWGGLVILAYAAGGYLFLRPLRNGVLEPRLDRTYGVDQADALTRRDAAALTAPCRHHDPSKKPADETSRTPARETAATDAGRVARQRVPPWRTISSGRQ